MNSTQRTGLSMVVVAATLLIVVLIGSLVADWSAVLLVPLVQGLLVGSLLMRVGDRTSSRFADWVGSPSYRIWFGSIGGAVLWIAGGSVLLEQPRTDRVIARTVVIWFVATMLNLIAIRTALRDRPHAGPTE